jgi:hypothetical protein
MATRLFRCAAIALAITNQSCGTSAPSHDELVPVPSTPPTLQVDVGTGSTEFIALTDGESVDLVHGDP